MNVKDNTPWEVFKLFNDPPGTPKNLKCIACKVIAGCGLLFTGGVLFYGAKKLMHRNIYNATAVALLGLGSTSGSAVVFRVAYEHKIYNDRLIKELQKSLRDERQMKELGKLAVN